MPCDIGEALVCENHPDCFVTERHTSLLVPGRPRAGVHDRSNARLLLRALARGHCRLCNAPPLVSRQQWLAPPPVAIVLAWEPLGVSVDFGEEFVKGSFSGADRHRPLSAVRTPKEFLLAVVENPARLPHGQRFGLLPWRQAPLRRREPQLPKAVLLHLWSASESTYPSGSGANGLCAKRMATLLVIKINQHTRYQLEPLHLQN